MTGLISDLRALNVPEDFQGGNNSQRARLNAIIGALNEIIAAAERATEPKTIEIYINEAGESVPVQFYIAG